MDTNNVKLCPHCGGKMFAAKIIRGCIVESTEEGFKILKENTDKFDVEVVKCGRCKKEVRNEDLTNGVKCTSCGKTVNPSDLNENGVCSVCQAQKERSELANASREDLIRMLLEAERKVKTTTVPDVTVQPSSPVIQSEPVSDLVPEVPKSEKKRRSAARKTEAPVFVESESSETEAAKEVKSEVDLVANQQEAPFPELNPPEPPTLDIPSTSSMSTEEQFGVNNFEMFQDEKI